MFMKVEQIVKEPSVKLFVGERWLICTGILGLMLSLGIALFILLNGHIILPEGNLKNAFSFDAAIGIYVLSIAAILPLSRFSDRKRNSVRWLMIMAILYGYAIETIQNFRGLNPRFSNVGTIMDIVAGLLFGIISLFLVALAIVLTVHYFRLKPPYERPLLLLGIRYAFLSIIVANLAGIWMIILQDRFTGDAGNLIVLHGIGFHALQTLILPAWLLEKSQLKETLQKRIIHFGSIAWMLMILFLGIQTGLGRSVFELTILPIIGGCLLIAWFTTVIMAVVLFIRQKRNSIALEQSTLLERSSKKTL